jgi:hypothetical protein
MWQQFGLCAGTNGRHLCNTHCEQLKRLTSLELEQHLKGLKVQEIAAELSSAYGQDAYARPSITYWLHQINLGRTDLQT